MLYIAMELFSMRYL